ncbi:SusC/RagA family TonB-linked outer membrane protein [Flavilitoribacter nigricans]|nr:TonB-dependent receptor [Flavilitoribacter nigricans]
MSVQAFQLPKGGVTAFILSCILCLLGPFQGYSQSNNPISVTGQISSEEGEPLIGANILVKGTSEGTVTDWEGKFQMQAGAGDTLEISYIGFNNKLVPVQGRNSIDIVLETNATGLSEVVVIGYGEVKRANLVGSVSSLSADDIEDIPAINLTSLLDGRMPGVNVSPAQPTGNPGAQTRVRIRAETTFGTSGGGAKDPAPLYIVDGFQMTQEEFDVLDPTQIESFSVLKDASAAVYGSKGANGVILVKTKRGRVGKLSVNYSGSMGLSDATQQTEMLSAYDHARMLNAINVDNPGYVPISAEELEAMRNLNYNWLEDAWKQSLLSNHSINFSGGTEKIKYFAGGSYTYTEGNFEQMDVGKYSYRLGLDAQITNDLQVSATVALDNRNFKRPYLSGAGINTMEGLFQQLLQAPKWTPPFIDGLPVYNNLDFNPMALFNSGSYRSDLDKGNTLNLRATYKFPTIEGLSATASISRREGYSYTKEYNIPYTLYEFQPQFQYILSDQLISEQLINNRNRISESFSNKQNYQLNLNLNYNRSWGEHTLSAFATYEQMEGKSSGFGALAENLLIYGVETQRAFDYLSAVSQGAVYESGDLGAVARLNYSFADKYLLESTVRYESTVLFAPGERSGFFPAVAIGWVASEEPFLKENVNFIDYLKFRLSVGLTGYSSVGAYEYNLSYAPSGSYLFGGSTAVPGLAVSGKTDVISSGVSWEKSQMHNLGMDLKLLQGRLSFAVDVYYTKQYDILDKRTVEFPQSSGITDLPSENLGRLNAWGYDMSIGYRGQPSQDFSWNISGNFSFATNRILQRPTQWAPNDFRYPIGQSTFAAGREEGYFTEGIIRTQEQLDAINAMWVETWGHVYTIEGKPAEVGSLYFQDIGRPGDPNLGEPETVFEPDGEIHRIHDKTYIERVNDNFTWKNLLPTNISLGFTWKNFRVSTLWGMAYGISNQVVDKLARSVVGARENSPAFWSDFWSPDNTDAAYPNPKFGTYNEWASTFWMRDVYQLRLKNVNISYRLPQELSERRGIPELRIFLAGTNLWSPISTFDYKEDAISRYNTYPLLRSLSLGLNVRM